MKNKSFAGGVNEKFEFLINDYGCSVATTTAESIVFQSKNFKCRVVLDRNQVFVDVGPVVELSDWFDLGVITAYLTQNSRNGEWEYEIPKGVTTSKATEVQIERLANILQQYIGQIVPLFREKPYKHIKPELMDFWRRRSEALLNK